MKDEQKPLVPTTSKEEPNFKKILREIPLETRLFVSNQMSFISLLTELGYREDKAWGEDENELLEKLTKAAQKHTDYQLEELKEWKKDGSPVETLPKGKDGNQIVGQFTFDHEKGEERYESFLPPKGEDEQDAIALLKGFVYAYDVLNYEINPELIRRARIFIESKSKGEDEQDAWNEVAAIVQGLSNFQLYDHVLAELKSKYRIHKL